MKTLTTYLALILVGFICSNCAMQPYNGQEYTYDPYLAQIYSNAIQNALTPAKINQPVTCQTTQNYMGYATTCQ